MPGVPTKNTSHMQKQKQEVDTPAPVDAGGTVRLEFRGEISLTPSCDACMISQALKLPGLYIYIYISNLFFRL